MRVTPFRRRLVMLVFTPLSAVFGKFICKRIHARFSIGSSRNYAQIDADCTLGRKVSIKMLYLD